MFNRIDLRTLAERRGPDRAFLSLYLRAGDGLGDLEGRVKGVRALLDEGEAEHFDANLEAARAFLGEHGADEGPLVLFACWAIDYLEAFRLGREVPALLRVDAAPYLRPLAELQDELEDFVVVTADNQEARVYYVDSAVPTERETVEGDVKNPVKKGGWSQQRYARRREKELLHYAKEVAGILAEVAEQRDFDRIVLLGSDEAMREIEGELTPPVRERLVGSRAVDLKQEDEVWDAAFELFFEEERAAERSLWQEIRDEYLSGGRAATGAEHVAAAAAVGRVERLLVTRDAELEGTRCRACENLAAEPLDACPVCDSDDTFEVDLVEELVELVAVGGGSTEFSDNIRGLTRSGHVAALLRY